MMGNKQLNLIEEEQERVRVAPFVKWAGGKTQLLDSIKALFPKRFNHYHEPFLGGGAVFFKLQPHTGTINDLNKELMTAFAVIRDNPDKLIEQLKALVVGHNKGLEANVEGKTDSEIEKERKRTEQERFYYYVRSQKVEDLNDIEVAARFIYLNKTGFNGLYRVNRDGGFNVPCAKKGEIKTTTLYSLTNIKNMNKYLNTNKIDLYNTDFAYVLDKAEEGDMVFIDSPYDESWAGYQADGFGEEEHRRLADMVHELDRKGVKFMLTNHNTPLINELYAKYKKLEVPVNRFINSDASKRQNSASEVIIINYDITYDQMREFKKTKFFKQLKPTSFVLKDYVNWDKIKERMKENDLAINDLNYLFAGSKEELDENFEKLYAARPESFEILPLLISVRNKKFMYLDDEGEVVQFNYMSKEIVREFLQDSGLEEKLFLNSQYTSVKDYLLGLEVGLSNADKKNLVGKWFVEQIENILNDHNIPFKNEVSYNSILNMKLDRDKRFDFVFNISGKTYCMEVNFFNTSGSKINSESARFLDLNRTFMNYSDLEFIWVTDGVGLKKNKTQIEQALEQLKHMYNLETFREFISEITE